LNNSGLLGVSNLDNSVALSHLMTIAVSLVDFARAELLYDIGLQLAGRAAVAAEWRSE
jgi:hypothetical protein